MGARERKKRRIGITTTLPVEPFLSSGCIPCDLNNLFITHEDPPSLVERAEVLGFPRNICTWIKGLHSVSLDMDGVVGVVRGDCSNTESLLETLLRDGIGVHSFSYPPDRDRDAMEKEIRSLCSYLGTDIGEAADMAERVEGLRSLARRIDDLRWRRLRITAQEAHLAQVSSSDFDSDPDSWEMRMKALIKEEGGRDPPDGGPRIAYIGVPPIITDIYPVIEGLGGRTVFFEVQRQFTFPSDGDWIGKYLLYTYPYDLDMRIDDILKEVDRRDVDGIVHYVQSFCHRQIDDVIFRKELGLPLLTVEGNLPGPMDRRTLIRLEAFLDILEGR